jgi:ATPase
MKEKIVPDTSVLISGILTDLIEKGEISEAEIIIPEFAVEELRAQASKGREIGFKGLDEIKKLRTMYKNITMTKYGRRQTMEEIQLARSGRIDALIIDVARENDAAIYTSDYVQFMFAEAEGIKARYLKKEGNKAFFNDDSGHDEPSFKRRDSSSCEARQAWKIRIGKALRGADDCRRA